MTNLKDQFLSLDRIKKGGILILLLGVTVTAGLTVYTRYKAKLAQENEAIAERYRTEAMVARAEADKFKASAEALGVKLEKANSRVTKLQAELDKIVVPPKPEQAPTNVLNTLKDLQAMGLQLVVKPSMTVAPSVAGITGQDATAIWFWGKDSQRVPFLEAKVEKSAEVIKGLEKAMGLAESVAEVRTKQADAATLAADAHKREAESIRTSLDATKSALNAERKKKYLIAIGALGLGYAASRR